MSANSNYSHNGTMIPDAYWQDLYERHEMAYFRGQIATSSPQSYSIDEMHEISDGMESSTREVEQALRSDFQSMPPQTQVRMLDLLQQADPSNYDWWIHILVGEMPTSPEQLERIER